ncbi:TrmH family RNA methyltransferase [Aureibacillus halotolerans]|uniref:TrmH family RNA methyltransferase n=1 Tax=Aureibacillus halotolerans TaxID=1508390 RepID=A0A4R6U3T4_9BACI|nr:RNA methyltransferase [Aureibacillus halotolerans]TDQ39169.1 TrmH family RNA methyltransferase [Aureibacillus halotolerans]
MKQILSVQNPLIKQCKKLKAKKYREEQGQFLIDGQHLLQEAISAQLSLEYIFYDPNRCDPPQNTDAECIECSEEIIRALSDTPSPQGIIAVAEMPNEPDSDLSAGRYVLLDDVQDPGNVGTIIRTAEVLGMTGVVLGEHCADVYSSKTIRSTQGALFHIPILRRNLQAFTEELHQHHIPLLATAMNGESLEEAEVPLNFAILFGNEGKGVSPALLDKAAQLLTIPMAGKTESLNVTVAAGIVLYRLHSKR